MLRLALGLPLIGLRESTMPRWQLPHAQRWPLARTERALMLLGKYSTMAVGIKSGTDDRELLKELIGQLLQF